MNALKEFLNSTAMNVFLGTLPLTGAILWGLIQNDKRLSRIEAKIDGMDTKLANVSERLVKVETKLEGPHVVLAR